jgi:hypothetical protein
MFGVPLHGFFGVDATVGDVVNLFDGHAGLLVIVGLACWIGWSMSAIRVEFDLSFKRNFVMNLF